MSKKEKILVSVAILIGISLIVWQVSMEKKNNVSSENQAGVIEQEIVSDSGNESENKDNENQDIIYYYGQECSHCQNVAKFLGDNKIAEKVDFAKKEVWHNKANSEEMKERAKNCGLNLNMIGVPFLYGDGKCYVGEPEVMGFFKKKAGLQ